jgi:putative ABC transport system substrate-binding protein
VIPIVFGMGGDPVQAGLAESFNRPGGNATGYTILTTELEPKRIGLLRELVPGIPLMGALLGPTSVATHQLKEIEDATRKLGQRLFVAKAGNDGELDAAFASLIQERVGALLVAASAYFDTRRARIISFAAENKLPAIYQLREYAAAGGLISYGPRITDSYYQAGIYVGRILRGAKPADLPVLQASRFELVINMKTANALGLAVPNSMQLLADEVIE